MRRVLVIGSGGAGKSALSVQLGPVPGLPVVHLGRLYWAPGWTEPDKEAWRKTVSDLLGQDRWLKDGNYSGTLDLRIPAADTIIYLDFPPLLCLWRVIKRRFQYENGGRPDMAPGCDERLDAGFLKWIWSFRRERRPGILRQIAEHGSGKEAVFLTGPKEVESFLSEVRARKPQP